jgi:lipopolysaccharide/colanic/teichoic acid biosynthesis glycosyltransferase
LKRRLSQDSDRTPRKALQILPEQRHRIRCLVDRVAGCLLIVLTLPLLAIVSLAIKLERPGPVFRRREPVRFGRSRFSSSILRTRPHHPRHSYVPWMEDGHFTPLGRFLRYTRIDRLPRLINVLRGEMTVIGGTCGRPNFLE